MGDNEFDFKFNALIQNTVSEQDEFNELLETSGIYSDARKRKNIIKEFYFTEVSYILQLELLIKYFILPFKDSPHVPASYLNELFGNVLQLYKVNRELLEVIRKNPYDICGAFCMFAPFLKLYSIYAFGYKRALKALEELERRNRKVCEFLRCQETRPEVGASLISLLIAPIQRVPRYRLLLQSLLEATAESHSQFMSTKDALLKAEETALHINKLVSESEEGEAMLRLARRLGSRGDSFVIPGRKIIKQGILMKTSKNGTRSQQRYVILFTDALLICKGCEKGPLTMSRLLPLRHLQAEPALGAGLFKVIHGEDCVLFYTAEPDSGAEWLRAIEETVLYHAACQRTLRKEGSRHALRVRGILNSAKAKAASMLRTSRLLGGSNTLTNLSLPKRLKQRRRCRI